jgi:hypothetical protein
LGAFLGHVSSPIGTGEGDSIGAMAPSLFGLPPALGHRRLSRGRSASVLQS